MDDAATAGGRARFLSKPLSTLLCAGVVWAFAILFTNILPTILELLRERLALNASQMGSIGSAYVLGGGLVVATGPFWVRRVSFVAASMITLLLTAAALASLAFCSSVSSFVIGWFVIGLAAGVAGMPAYVILGDTKDPTRAYSLALFGATLLATALSFALPTIDILNGLLVIAVSFALSAPFALGMRGSGPSPSLKHAHAGARAGRDSRRLLAAPILAMLGGALFLGVSWGGVFNFTGVISAANGLDARAAGWLVAVGLVGALAGSLAPTLIGRRFASPITIISLAVIIILFSYPAMMLGWPAPFIAGFAVQCALTTLVFSYLLGFIRQLDVNGRMFIAFPAIQAVGTGASTKFTGWFLLTWTVSSYLAIAAALIALSWLVLATSHWIGALRRPAPAPLLPTESPNSSYSFTGLDDAWTGQS